MRDNSGGGKSQNNNRNPTLRDQEREKGVSGEAIQGEKKAATPGERKQVHRSGGSTAP
jgi:hypothetical protein